MTHSRTMLGVAVLLLAGCSPSEDPGREEVGTIESWRQVRIGPTLLTRSRRVTLPDGRVLEGRVVALPRAGSEGEDEGEAEPPNEERCYSFLFPDQGAGNGRWLSPARFILDPSNGSGLSPAFVESRITRAMQTWNERLPASLLGPYDTTGVVDGIDLDAPDGKNEIFFGAIDDPSFVALASLWWDAAERRIVEADVVLDDVDYTFGDCGPTNELAPGDPRFFDLEDVATHELGHAVGLGHPDESCTQETMYGFSGTGDTFRRTLHSGDIAGVTALYR